MTPSAVRTAFLVVAAILILTPLAVYTLNRPPTFPTTLAPVAAWSEPVRVGSGRCISFWTANPDADDLLIEVRRSNDLSWQDFREHVASQKAQGQNPRFAWIRFKSKMADPVPVSYEFKKVGQCT